MSDARAQEVIKEMKDRVANLTQEALKAIDDRMTALGTAVSKVLDGKETETPYDYAVAIFDRDRSAGAMTIADIRKAFTDNGQRVAKSAGPVKSDDLDMMNSLLMQVNTGSKGMMNILDAAYKRALGK